MTAALRKLDDTFSETAIDDEIVLMSLESGDFFSLQGTARSIWLLIDGSRTRANIVAALAAEYDVEPGAIAPDLDAFVAELQGVGVLAGG